MDNKNTNILTKTYSRVTLTLLCCFLWGSAFPCIKMGYDWLGIKTVGEQILFAGYRFFLAGIITFCLACIFEKKIIKLKRANIIHILEFGLLNTTLQYVCFYIGLNYVSGTKGSILNAANVFVSIILAHFFFDEEKITWLKSIGCLIGFAGVIIINLGDFGGNFSFMGEGMVILSTIIYGTCSVLVKFLVKQESPMTITAYQLSFGGAVLIVIGFANGGHVMEYDFKSLLLLLYLAILSSVAFSIWTALLNKNEAGKVTVFGFSIPIFGSLLSSLLLGEKVITLKNFIAFICVCAGIIIINLPKSRHKKIKSFEEG